MQIINNISLSTPWWRQVMPSLSAVFDSIRIPSEGQAQTAIQAQLDALHNACSTVHRVDMPMYIQVQLIAALCNLQISYCAGFENQHHVSTKYHIMAQAQWIMFQELLKNEGIHCRVLQ